MPDKKSHHAHKLCRLLMLTGAPDDIGPEACWMITAIAHTEDAKHYSGPVSFWRDSFVTACGCGSIGRMGRIRQRAIDAGWLVYVKGNRYRAARYETAIPLEYQNLPDTTIDEPPGGTGRQSSMIDPQPEFGRDLAVEQPKSSRATFNPNPNPNPNPKKKPAAADLSFDAVVGRMSEKDRASSSVLDCPQFRDEWALWLDHRKELGKSKMTKSSAMGQIKMLAKLGLEDAVAMLDHTRTSGWVGLRAPDTNDSPEQKGFL